MADTKISALPAASALADVDLLPVVQGGVTSQATMAQLRSLFGINTVSLAVGFADLATAASTVTLPFAAALPAGAVFVASHIDVTEAFKDAGDTTHLEVTLDGATQARFGDYIDLSAIEVVYGSKGAAATTPGLVGAITPAASFSAYSATVNLDTLVQGAAVLYVHYIDVTGLL